MRRLLAGVALALAAGLAHAQMNGGVMESQKQGTAAITGGAINGATIGATTPSTGSFTTLTTSSTTTLSPANANVVASPTGTGTVTVNPATAGTLNNVSIGATTAATGRFTSAQTTTNTDVEGGGFKVTQSGANLTANHSLFYIDGTGQGSGTAAYAFKIDAGGATTRFSVRHDGRVAMGTGGQLMIDPGSQAAPGLTTSYNVQQHGLYFVNAAMIYDQGNQNTTTFSYNTAGDVVSVSSGKFGWSVGTDATVAADTHVTRAVAGTVAFNGAIARPIVTETNASRTVAATDTHIIANRAGTITLTLPTATIGRELTVRTIQAQTVVSNTTNVVPCAGGAAAAAILAATAGKWAYLVADGTNWQIQMCN